MNWIQKWMAIGKTGFSECKLGRLIWAQIVLAKTSPRLLHFPKLCQFISIFPPVEILSSIFSFFAGPVLIFPPAGIQRYVFSWRTNFNILSGWRINVNICTLWRDNCNICTCWNLNQNIFSFRINFNISILFSFNILIFQYFKLED